MIKVYKDTKELSSRQLSLKLGISRRMLQLIIEGYYEFPSDNLIEKFAKATDSTFTDVMHSLTFQEPSKTRTQGTSHKKALEYLLNKTIETLKGTKEYLISQGEEIEYCDDIAIIITKSNKCYEIFRHFDGGEDRFISLELTMARFYLNALYEPRYQRGPIIVPQGKPRHTYSESHLVFYSQEELGAALDYQIKLPTDYPIKCYADSYNKIGDEILYHEFLLNVGIKDLENNI